MVLESGLYFLVFIIGTNTFAQYKTILNSKDKRPKRFISSNKIHQARLSPNTKSLIGKLNKLGIMKNGGNELSPDFCNKYFIRINPTGNFVGGLIKVEQGFNEKILKNMNIKVGTKAGDIWTVQIPLSMIEKLSEIESVKYLQIDEPIQQELDNAKSSTWVDWVQQGFLLPQSYSGKDVVVGIIDGGFDYTHPMFYDTTGANYRIKKVWEQNAYGTPPSGYSYGHEIIGASNILAALYDEDNASHGTHVTGIAAGGGAGTNGKYKGIASGADIVLVSDKLTLSQMITTGQSNIIDGINYIFSFANSVGKPAVINMSLGTHLGPHDGTSLFDQACDNLVDHGKILVGAAGNEGNTP